MELPRSMFQQRPRRDGGLHQHNVPKPNVESRIKKRAFRLASQLVLASLTSQSGSIRNISMENPYVGFGKARKD